jgi:rhodanese-related sulfurtransferase
VILALMAAAGTVYTISTDGNPRKHLSWVNPMLGKGVPTLPGRTPTEVPTMAPTEPSSGGPAAKVVDPKVADAKVAPPEGVNPEAPDPKASSEPPPSLPEGEGFRFAEYDEVLQLYLDGATFVDARRSDEYEKGHITGAVSISYWEEDAAAKIARFKGEYPVEMPVVIYCTRAKDCEDSQLLAQQLHQAGFLNLLVYHGGFPEWEERHPKGSKEASRVTTGPKPGER